MTSDNHQIVSEHLEEGLTAAAGMGAARQAGAQAPLDLRDRAFRLPALAVFAAVKTPLHRAAVAARGPFASGPPPVEFDDRAANAQALARQGMVVLPVI